MPIDILVWVLLAEGLAWIWFVLAFPLFESWPDRGFGLSKACGTLAFGAASWPLVWSRAASSSRSGSAMVFVALLLSAAAAAVRRRKELAAYLSSHWTHLVPAQAVFWAAFAGFALCRAALPDISGAEKFMDFAFLNASIRASSLPPPDPWLSGFAINYYYFGYFTWALVAKLAGTPSSVAYNLAVATIPAQVAAGTYSIALALTGSRRASSAGALGLVSAGNLAGVLQATAVGPGYDVWKPTRVIDGTINEFPFFTFVWGDLHPHLMAMPNFVAFVGFWLLWFGRARTGRREWTPAAAVGVSSGIALVTSSWDIVPMALLMAASLIATGQRSGARRAAGSGAVIAAGVLAIAWPAFSGLESGVRVGFVAASSALGPFLLVQGGWLVPMAVLLAVGSAGLARRSAWVATLLAAVAAGLAARSMVVGLLAVLAAAVLMVWRRSPGQTAWPLVAAAIAMLMLPEIVFVDDIYGRELERLNTVFKLHLHACLLLGLTWAFCIHEAARITRGSRARRLAGALALSVTAAALATFPIGAAWSRFAANEVRTLDGVRYLEQSEPGDRAAIMFLNREVQGQPVVAEATGDAYRYWSRISANTGLPTILGWANHERVWRRGARWSDEIDRRLQAVKQLYEGDAATARSVMRKFRVEYVVVGDLERRTYPAGDFAKFERLGRQVFESLGTRVFRVDAGGGADAPRP